MNDDIRLELVRWPARVINTAELRDDSGVFLGFTITLMYTSLGKERTLVFHMNDKQEARQFLIGNEITICLEART